MKKARKKTRRKPPRRKSAGKFTTGAAALDLDNHQSLRTKFDHAVRLNKARKTEAAIKLLRTLAKEYPNSPAVHGYLAGVYRRNGRNDLAAKLFRKTTALSPESELASRGLLHSLLDLNEVPAAITELKRFLRVKDLTDYRQMMHDLTKSRVRSRATNKTVAA